MAAGIRDGASGDLQPPEHYTYHDYRLNPGLTERDFDTANRDYGF